jgi:hypothetical protein
MAEKFVGVVMKRDYTWGYTCEHCGKRAELQNAIQSRYGRTYTKALSPTVPVYLTEEGKQLYLAQGRAEFPNACEVWLARWKRGEIPEDLTGPPSVCPHCKKHQHWSNEIRDLGPKGKSKVGIIISAFFLSLLGTLLVFLVSTCTIAMIRDKELGPVGRLITLILAVLFWIALWVGFIIAQQSTNKDLLQERADLEHKEKQVPAFVSWGKTYEDI